MTDPRTERIRTAAAYVSEKLNGRPSPQLGIILGSGLGSLADHISDKLTIPYAEIPGFPVSTAIGHESKLIYGTLGGKKVLAMQGRFHFYEGYTMEQITMPVRVMHELGVGYLFVSNACGGVNRSFGIGDLMVITNHINLIPNPLIGPNMSEYGPRFPDMTRPYDPGLRDLAFKVAAEMGISLQEGCYAACTGPSFETPAEYKFFRIIGGDVVGMSTVPEVIVARHCGMRVFGMSVITDLGHDDMPEDYVADAYAVIQAADKSAAKMTELFVRMIERL